MIDIAQLLIAGIDPGTTIGFALINLNGKIVYAGSGKTLELKGLIANLTRYGSILITSTDKKKCPAFVSKFASNIGSITFSPDEDLLVKEKFLLLKKYLPESYPYKLDTHAKDALASAFIAYGRYSPLLLKVRKFCTKHNIDNRKPLYKLILHNPRINITAAFEQLQEKPKPINETKDKPAQEIRPRAIDTEVERLRKDVSLLTKQNQKLFSELQEFKRFINSIVNKPVSRTSNERQLIEIIKLKEKRFLEVKRELEQKDKLILDIKKDIKDLNLFLQHSDDCIIIKRLQNLSKEEFARKSSFYNIVKDHIIAINNPAVISSSILPLLKAEIIISDKQTKLSLTFIKRSDLKIMFENEYYLCIDKASFEKRLRKTDITKLIDEYKEERKSLLS